MSTRDSRHRREEVRRDPLRRRVIVMCACGQSYAVPIPSTTTMRDWLQRAQCAHATGSAWTCWVGCHVGDFADFDHYLDVNGIPLDRAGEAFAEYLTFEHGWKGQFRPVDRHVVE